MKKIALLALAASAAAIATPSMAQTATGTIDITGTVTGKCAVINGATSSTWAATVNMGELADSNGILESTGTLASRFDSVAGGAQNARVVCTSATGTIKVEATPLSNGAAVANFANVVDFQANVLVDKNTAADQTYIDDSTGAATGPTNIGDYLNPTGTNITVSTSNWRTITPSATAVLKAGSYTGGKIVVTIAPAVAP